MPKQHSAKQKTLAILLYIGGVFFVGSLLAWPLWELIQNTPIKNLHSSITKATFGRVTNRSFLLTAFIGIWPLARYLQCNTKSDFGLNTSRKAFFKSFLKGHLFGIITLSLFAGILYLFNLILLKDNLSSQDFSNGLIAGLKTGIVVALIEEIFFRGILTRVFQQASNFLIAILSSSFIYAAVHFIKGNSKTHYPEIHWYSGFVYLKSAFHLYTDIAFVGSFLTLFIVGIFLAALTLKQGNIALAAGIHAGWVCIIKTTQNCTFTNNDYPYLWLIGNYDNITGYLAFLWLMIICGLSWLYLERTQNA